MTQAKRVRVLIVDDSALVRNILQQGLSAHPRIEVVGTATNPYEARDLLVQLRPDVLTLDVEMPRMDGITFLRKLMAVMPTPTIVFSSLTQQGSTLEAQAMEAGAVGVLPKPTSGIKDAIPRLLGQLTNDVLSAASRPLLARAPSPPAPAPDQSALDTTTDFVIGFGASTGGISALTKILPEFPAWSPGLVIVQHIPPGFTAGFVQRMNDLCQMRVSEARHGERILRGHILVCPGGERHLEVRRHGGEYRCELARGPLVNGHVPSVDVFFESLARYVGRNAAACLLTGMGVDGARGLLALRLAGGSTIAQDQETAAVWGMPGAAVELGAAEAVLPLHAIPAALGRLDAVRAGGSAAASR